MYLLHIFQEEAHINFFYYYHKQQMVDEISTLSLYTASDEDTNVLWKDKKGTSLKGL